MKLILSTPDNPVHLKEGQTIKLTSTIVNQANTPFTVMQYREKLFILDPNRNEFTWWADYDEVLFDFSTKKEDYITLLPNESHPLTSWEFKLCNGQIEVHQRKYSGYYLKTLEAIEYYILLGDIKRITFRSAYKTFDFDMEHGEKSFGITDLYTKAIISNRVEVEIEN